MNSSDDVQLLESRRIDDFLPVMRELEHGDRFLLSMLHWCGFGQRSTKLDYWQVLLITHRAEVAGVTGLYRPPDSDSSVFWIGWFGVRPKHRRSGVASAAIELLVDRARRQGARELKVYTGAHDSAALAFYEGFGFDRIGVGSAHADGQPIEVTDVVFRMQLAPTEPAHG
ncbi:MAG: GNAT family N-acetyltransferase [Verrucomicrobia bacterium]|nr:GNAT family N-acetyltransferase [Verrucomicrobiota bacterium]